MPLEEKYHRLLDEYILSEVMNYALGVYEPCRERKTVRRK